MAVSAGRTAITPGGDIVFPAGGMNVDYLIGAFVKSVAPQEDGSIIFTFQNPSGEQQTATHTPLFEDINAVADALDTFIGSNEWRSRLSGAGLIAAIDAASGGTDWRSTLSGAQLLAAIDAATSGTTWRSRMTGAELIAALDTATGSTAWRSTLSGQALQDAIDAATGGAEWRTALAGSDLQAAIDAATGSTAWRTRLTSQQLQDAIDLATGGTTWRTGLSGADVLSAIDTATGGTAWRTRLSSQELLTAIDTAIGGSGWRSRLEGQGLLTAIDTATGGTTWRSPHTVLRTAVQVRDLLDGLLGSGWRTGGGGGGSGISLDQAIDGFGAVIGAVDGWTYDSAANTLTYTRPDNSVTPAQLDADGTAKQAAMRARIGAATIAEVLTQILAGSNITIDRTTDGQITLASTAAGGSGITLDQATDAAGALLNALDLFSYNSTSNTLTLSPSNQLTQRWADIPSGTAIARGKVVEHGGAFFGCITNHNRSSTGPDGDAANWALLSNFQGAWSAKWYPAGSFVSHAGLPYMAGQAVVNTDPAPNAATNTKWLALGSAEPAVVSGAINQNIPATANGHTYVLTGSTARTFFLPNASGTGEVPNAWEVVIVNRSSANLSVEPNGTDRIDGSGALTVKSGEATILQKVASGAWAQIADTEKGTGGGGGSGLDQDAVDARIAALVNDDRILDLAKASRVTGDRGKFLGVSASDENDLALLDAPSSGDGGARTEQRVLRDVPASADTKGKIVLHNEEGFLTHEETHTEGTATQGDFRPYITANYPVASNFLGYLDSDPTDYDSYTANTTWYFNTLTHRARIFVGDRTAGAGPVRMFGFDDTDLAARVRTGGSYIAQWPDDATALRHTTADGDFYFSTADEQFRVVRNYVAGSMSRVSTQSFKRLATSDDLEGLGGEDAAARAAAAAAQASADAANTLHRKVALLSIYVDPGVAEQQAPATRATAITGNYRLILSPPDLLTGEDVWVRVFGRGQPLHNARVKLNVAPAPSFMIPFSINAVTARNIVDNDPSGDSVDIEVLFYTSDSDAGLFETRTVPLDVVQTPRVDDKQELLPALGNNQVWISRGSGPVAEAIETISTPVIIISNIASFDATQNRFEDSSGNAVATPNGSIVTLTQAVYDAAVADAQFTPNANAIFLTR